MLQSHRNYDADNNIAVLKSGHATPTVCSSIHIFFMDQDCKQWQFYGRPSELQSRCPSVLQSILEMLLGVY